MNDDYDYTYELVGDLTPYCDELGRVLPEYRDKEFWVMLPVTYEVRLIAEDEDGNPVLIDVKDGSVKRWKKVYTRTPKPKPIPIPSCVPDGWWVYLVSNLDGDRYWWTSSNEPTKIPKFGFTCGSGHDNASLDKVLFPELYEWDGPIEQACVQVDRPNR